MEPLDPLFRALADPRRRALIARLRDGPATVADLTRAEGVSQPAISQAVAKLKAAGLARAEPRGRATLYHLEPAPLRALDDWLDDYRDAWADRLDRLGDHLSEDHR